jgi:hypothetical protein
MASSETDVKHLRVYDLRHATAVVPLDDGAPLSEELKTMRGGHWNYGPNHARDLAKSRKQMATMHAIHRQQNRRERRVTRE